MTLKIKYNHLALENLYQKKKSEKLNSFINFILRNNLRLGHVSQFSKTFKKCIKDQRSL